MLFSNLKGQAGVAAGVLAVVVAVVAVANFANLQLSSNQVAQSIVAHWKLDETSGSTVSDSAGGDDSGSVNNDAGNQVTDAPWTASGRIGGGLDNSVKFYHIKVPNSARINNLPKYTMALWFKQTTAGTQSLIKKGDVELYTYSGTIRASISGIQCDSGLPISLNTWYHAAVTYDGPTVQIYVNGQLKRTCYPPGLTNTNTADMYIGAENPSTLIFKGIIDDVRLYNYALPAVGQGETISNLFSSAPPLASPSTTVPTAPVNLGAQAGNGQVTLLWLAPSNTGGSAITNYKIYRGTSSATKVLVATLVNVPTFTDTGLTNGQQYFYEISAVNSALIS